MTTYTAKLLANVSENKTELLSVYTTLKVNTIINSLYNQPIEKKGLIVGMPTTATLIRACAANLLHPNHKTINDMKKKTIEPIHFDGWIIVIPTEKQKLWKKYASEQYCYTSTNSLSVPFFTVITYDTIGLLNTFHSLLENYLLIFENAEFLIDILHQQKNQKSATIYSVIQKCKKSLFFTTNIHLVDIHELQYVIDKRDTIPNNIRQIRNKYENKKSFALSQFNELFLQPSTRMMAQFIVVLGLVMNARQVYFKKSNKNDTYSSTAHVTNQRRKNKKAKKKTLK